MTKPDLKSVMDQVEIPEPFSIKPWSRDYFDGIRELSSAEGWTTPELRPDETLLAWEKSWPTLVAVDSGRLSGFLRATTDMHITTYLCELLVVPEARRFGLGRSLVEVCQRLVPTTRMDLLSTGEEADRFYDSVGCVEFRGYRRQSRLAFE